MTLLIQKSNLFKDIIYTQNQQLQPKNYSKVLFKILKIFFRVFLKILTRIRLGSLLGTHRGTTDIKLRLTLPQAHCGGPPIIPISRNPGSIPPCPNKLLRSPGKYSTICCLLWPIYPLLDIQITNILDKHLSGALFTVVITNNNNKYHYTTPLSQLQGRYGLFKYCIRIFVKIL